MGVAFTNNWELLINKLQSVLSTEFGQTLKVYSSIKSITEASQYLQIKPAGSDSIEYYQDSEIREFSLSLELHYKNQNIKNRGFAQIMLLTSRVEEVISNNQTLTLFDNSKAHNCRIESTEINKDDPDEYIVIMDFKCVHANNSLTPAITITAAEVADGATSSDSGLSLTFTLNRDSDNFVVGDVDVTNGSLSSFSGSGSVYTATFTPSGSGATTIKVLADKFTGTNATGGNTASNVFNWTYVPKFISTWTTTSDGESIILPLTNGGTFNFTVDWGDGSGIDTITAYNDADATHVYASAGTYTVTIDGTITGWSFVTQTAQRNKIKTISNWGGLTLNAISCFESCQELEITANNAPTLAGSPPTMARMFYDCQKIVNIGTGWDVSSVQDFSYALSNCPLMNATDTVNWNMSSATDLNHMFYYSYAFNQDISGWNTSNVTNMLGMFRFNTSFNQNIGAWNTSNVTTFSYMFAETNNPFNNGGSSDINNWNVTSCINFSYMFRNSAFNQPINNWTFKTSGDINMQGMFVGATAFNSSLAWCDGTGRANNTARVTNMSYMFELGGDDVFTGIGVSNWDTSNVTTMVHMFLGCEHFNQDISSWNITSLTNATSMLQNANAWSNSYYDALLIAWEGQSEQSNVTFHAGDAVMTTGGAAEAARDALVANGWTITDSAGTHT